jgi:hypothetical protein
MAIVTLVVIIGLTLLLCRAVPQPVLHPTLDRGQPRLLDVLAEAVRPMQPPRVPNRVVRSVALHDQFFPAVNPGLWRGLSDSLSVTLPKLVPLGDGRWEFPNEMRTVFDLADHVAGQSTSMERPTTRSLSEWIDAQIYPVVCDTLIEALSVDREDIFRAAKLMDDLGAE